MAIEVVTDDRVRLTSAVLLLTPLAEENVHGHKLHPLRVETAEYVEDFRDHPCATAARSLTEKGHWISAFYCYAVLLDPVTYDLPSKDDRPLAYDAGQVMTDFLDAGFAAHLRRFHEDARLGSFWDVTADEWERARQECKTLVADGRVDEFLSLLYGESALPVVVVPDPVVMPWAGFGPNDGTTSYSIIGPPAVPPGSDRPVSYACEPPHVINIVFHEASHSAVGAAKRAYPAVVEQTSHLANRMELRGYFPESYPDWDIQFDEIVIRAATALYQHFLGGDSAAAAILEHEKREYGLDIIDQVYACLEGYLEQRKKGQFSGLEDYMPELSRQLARL